MTARRLTLGACVLALLGLGARQDYDARNIPRCTRAAESSQVRLESWELSDRVLETCASTSRAPAGPATPSVGPVLAVQLGAYPMDGSAVYSRARLRNGGSTPPRTTFTPTERVALIPARSVGTPIQYAPHGAGATVRARSSSAARAYPADRVTARYKTRSAGTLLTLHLSRADAVIAARVAVNEDSRPLRPTSDGGTAGEPTADTLAILQVVHDFAAWKMITPALAILRLAPHVSGARLATRRRHAVFATLPAYGAGMPELWTAADGPWVLYAEHWRRFRGAVLRLVRDGFPAPCDGSVIAWGGVMDTSIALSRGLVPVHCQGDTRNTFWARRSIVLPAAQAARAWQ